MFHLPVTPVILTGRRWREKIGWKTGGYRGKQQDKVKKACWKPQGGKSAERGEKGEVQSSSGSVAILEKMVWEGAYADPLMGIMLDWSFSCARCVRWGLIFTYGKYSSFTRVGGNLQNSVLPPTRDGSSWEPTAGGGCMGSWSQSLRLRPSETWSLQSYLHSVTWGGWPTPTSGLMTLCCRFFRNKETRTQIQCFKMRI